MILASALAVMFAQDSAAVPAIVGETHLRNVRQLTFGGQNAEAYWSADGRHITYQTRQPAYPDEQIFVMDADGRNKRLVSTGKGRCTCSYYSPDGRFIFFSSTHARNEGAQAPVDMSKGYVWAINPDYEMYRVGARTTTGGQVPSASGLKPASGNDAMRKVINRPGFYVAETTIAPNGHYMAWTSDFEGDLEIYRSNLDGSNTVRLTHEVGYDGGPFVSWDSKLIAYRRDSFTDDKQIEGYKALLAQHMIRPTKLEIWVMDANGENKRQVTHLACASFAPFIHPDGKRIVFSSNYGDPKGREFDVFICNLDGSNLERVTKSPQFDGFPMFTRDGKKIVFASDRFSKVKGETNVFVADWVD